MALKRRAGAVCNDWYAIDAAPTHKPDDILGSLSEYHGLGRSQRMMAFESTMLCAYHITSQQQLAETGLKFGKRAKSGLGERVGDRIQRLNHGCKPSDADCPASRC